MAEIEQSKADAIFTAIMNWIKYDIPNRSEDVEALLKYVSIKHLSLQNIRNNILADDFLNSNPSGCKWLVSSFLRNSSSFILGRKNSLLYISSLGVDSMNYEFDVHSRILVKQTARPFLFRCATMKLNDLIYAVGGEKDNQVADFGLTYDMRHKSWAPFSCPLNRTSCGVCTLDDKLYAICGLNANGRKLFSCLSYDAELDRWTNLQDMKNARRYPGAATYCKYNLLQCRIFVFYHLSNAYNFFQIRLFMHLAAITEMLPEQLLKDMIRGRVFGKISSK